MRDLDSNNHSVFALYYHPVLVVKYRRNVINDLQKCFIATHKEGIPLHTETVVERILLVKKFLLGGNGWSPN